MLEQPNAKLVTVITNQISTVRFCVYLCVFRSTSGDTVQLVEQSLDLNLLNNSLCLKIQNCAVLPGGVHIHETLNNVIVLIVTNQSVHRMVLPHPTRMYRSVSVSLFIHTHTSTAFYVSFECGDCNISCVRLCRSWWLSCRCRVCSLMWGRCVFRMLFSPSLCRSLRTPSHLPLGSAHMATPILLWPRLLGASPSSPYPPTISRVT